MTMQGETTLRAALNRVDWGGRRRIVAIRVLASVLVTAGAASAGEVAVTLARRGRLAGLAHEESGG